LDKKIEDGKTLYHVKWLNYSAKFNLWIPAQCFYYKSLIRRFEQEFKSKGKKTKAAAKTVTGIQNQAVPDLIPPASGIQREGQIQVKQVEEVEPDDVEIEESDGGEPQIPVHPELEIEDPDVQMLENVEIEGPDDVINEVGIDVPNSENDDTGNVQKRVSWASPYAVIYLNPQIPRNIDEDNEILVYEDENVEEDIEDA
jgi:hypothetical protein